MALTTRCPQCGTTFKVVPDQLRVRNGLVRCGACSTVFDGRACLVPAAGAAPQSAPPAAPVSPAASHAAPVLATPAVPAAPQVPPWEDEPEPPLAPARPPVAASAPPAVLRGRDDIRRRVEPVQAEPAEDLDEADDQADDDLAGAEEPPRWTAPAAARPAHYAEQAARGTHAEPSFTIGRARPDVRDEARDDEYDNEYADEHRDDDCDDYHDEYAGDREAPGEPVLGDTRTRYSSATDVGRAPPEFLDQDRQERRGLLRKLWGYACLVGLIALGLQLVYAYRTDIANSVPALRPVLETVCQPLGCTVGYARRLERIAIASSSLQPPPGAAAIDDGRSRLVLTLVLRNRYDKPQHWPALVLDLTDLSDTVVVRRVLKPEDYLTPEQLRGPFAPAGELKISVPIEVTGVQVNGYQLDKFFP